MSASTRIYVLVAKEVVSWVEVSAVTLEEAMREARQNDFDVVRVIRAQYEEPYTEEGTP